MHLAPLRNALGASAAALLALSSSIPATAQTRAAPAAPRVRLATTTSTENSGLLGYLLPLFARDSGYTVDVIAVGTGAALKLGENADADVLLVHARAQENAFMAAGHGSERRDVMYNDFVVLGPAADPASLAGSPNAAAAFAKLASSRTSFVSRGDKSGTHVKELEIWKAAGIVPSGAWYKEAGQGMEQVIIMADGLRAYALADRGTWLAVKDKTGLKVCYEGDPGLFNPYGVITVAPSKHPAINAAGAKAFLDWLTSPRGQNLIAGFTLGGLPLFFPNYKP